MPLCNKVQPRQIRKLYLLKAQWLKASGIITYSPGSNITLQPTKLFNCRLLLIIKVLKDLASEEDSRNTNTQRSNTPWCFSFPLQRRF